MYHKIVSLKLKSVIFSQIYWQELSKSIIKKPTCFKVGFLFILGFSIFTKWLISILITSVVLCWISHNHHYVKSLNQHLVKEVVKDSICPFSETYSSIEYNLLSIRT